MIPSNTIATCRQGKLQGYFTGRSLLFAGVPFAQPPVGKLRFRPPQPPKQWTGVRDAVHFRPIQPQKPSRFRRFLSDIPNPQSEDSLTLNIWTPDTTPAKRPVLIYIHGGAWVSGSGAMPLYHGERFAEQHGIVAISINYRLAELGNLYLGHLDPAFAASGNHALLDMVAALEWVRDNIAAFGGDPDNVTVMGESAGGHYALALMTAPQSKPLFHRAICHSTASITPLRTVDEAVATSERFFAMAGIKTIAGLEALPIEQLLDARHATMRAIASRRTIWGALMDGVVVPEQPLHAAAAGRLARVPLLIGDCGEDYRPFVSVIPQEKHPQNETQLVDHLSALGIDGAAALDLYRDLLPSKSLTDWYVMAMTDYYRQTSIYIAEQHSRWQPTFMFRFDWASPVQNGALGAGHTVELPFTFDTLHTPSTPYHLGNNPPAGLAKSMNAAWSAFARTGDPTTDQLPDWPRYAPSQRAVMALNAASQLQTDPAPKQRQLWADMIQSMLPSRPDH